MRQADAEEGGLKEEVEDSEEERMVVESGTTVKAIERIEDERDTDRSPRAATVDA